MEIIRDQGEDQTVPPAQFGASVSSLHSQTHFVEHHAYFYSHTCEMSFNYGFETFFLSVFVRDEFQSPTKPNRADNCPREPTFDLIGFFELYFFAVVFASSFLSSRYPKSGQASQTFREKRHVGSGSHNPT